MSKATNHCHLVEQGDKALVFFLLTETYMRQKLRHEKNGEKKKNNWLWAVGGREG